MFDFIKKSISSLKETLSSKVSSSTKVKKIVFNEVRLSDNDIDNFLWDFELSLLESDVPLEVVDSLKEDLRKVLKNHVFKSSNLDEEVKEVFEEFLLSVFEDLKVIDFSSLVNSKKPFVIMFLGPNGNGKTTTIAKIGYYLKNKLNKSVVFAACDTFRAGAIEQLEKHGEKVGIKVIKNKYGSDPTSIAFDTVKHAKSKGIDCVLIDTSGRQETNDNLMKEIKKMVNKINPDLKVLVLEAIIGNNSIEKIKEFGEFVDCVVITKYDLDTKGGILLSCAYYKKPILFLGIGQGYEDLIPFNKEEVVNKMIS